jgi:tetratricopeptide (TPR) repeat protein/tRNA A-37 threonylcarbamoyl transferase component Bud32
MADETSDSAVRDERVDEAIAAYLEAVDVGQEPDRDDFLRRHADIADELAAFFADHEQFQRLAEPLGPSTWPRRRRDTPAQGNGGASTVASGITARTAPLLEKVHYFGDYELLEEIARGGMGVVYKARQQSLNRIVALKMILAGRLASAADVQRFRTEAEAVAQLDHPHIVPIYEVGEHEGQHYFSMKLIQGGDLVCKLAEKRDQYVAARLLATVARAVHYAHQRGLLHRDLKPANILLDAAGNPYVTDFGLAKLLDRDSGLTPSGGIVGTPKYMAPEQAKAKNAVTTAADVYGLGAILYEMLTGRPPFAAATPLETMLQVLETEPARPRTISPRIKPDLETICLKCLEKDPGRRYGSAEALADDLDRFLSGEPILARHTGPAGRLWRWCRRKPLVASLTGALLLLFVSAFALVTWLWQEAEINYQEKEKQRLQAERNYEEAESLRIEAETNLAEAKRQQAIADQLFNQAHHTVRNFCVNLGHKRLANAPGLQMLRKELLEAGVDNYQKFVSLKGDDPAMQHELASTYGQLADITKIVAVKTDALKHYQQARAIFEKLYADHPDNVNIQADLGRTCNRLGILQGEIGQPSEESYRRAETLFEGLVAKHPKNINYVTDLAALNTNLGTMYRGMGKPQEAMAHFQRQLAIVEKLAAERPDELWLQRSLSIGYRNVASLHSDKKERTEALANLTKAVAAAHKLVRFQPESIDYQQQRCKCWQMLAIEQRLDGQKAEALATFQLAHDSWKKLVNDNPQVPHFHTDFIDVCRAMAELHTEAKRSDEATACYQEIRAALANLARLQPDDPEHQEDIAHYATESGKLHRAAKQYPEAMEDFQKACDIRRKQVEARPQDTDLRGELGLVLIRLAQMQWNLRKPEDALANVREAVGIQREIFRQAPDQAKYRRNLSMAYRSCAELVAKSGSFSEGADAYVEFRKLWPKDAEQQYTAGRELALIASWVGKNKVALSAGEKAERDKYAGLALEALRESVRLGFKDADRLQKDTYLPVLRDRDDFKKFLLELAQ